MTIFALKLIRRHIALIGFLIFFLASPAHAVDYDLSGFASIGAGRINTSDVRFEDYDDDISFDMDTNLGVQLDVSLHKRLSLTTQVASKGYRLSGESKYKPRFEWAYLTYQVKGNWKIRAGKTVVPFFMFSDFVDVGVAYPWLRPPIDVYAYFIQPISTHKGIELLYNGRVAGLDLDAQILWGRFKNKTGVEQQTYSIEGRPIKGFNVSLSNGTYTARYSYLDLKLSFISDDFEQLQSVYLGLGERNEIFTRIADSLNVGSESNIFQGIGFTADYDTWLINAEFVENRTKHDFSADLRSYYVSLAYQFDRFTPYFVVGAAKSENGSVATNLILESNELALTGIDKVIADTINDLALPFSVTSAHQKTLTAGVRFDINESVLFKFELERFTFYQGDNGQFRTIPGRATPDPVWMYSIAVDFVF